MNSFKNNLIKEISLIATELVNNPSESNLEKFNGTKMMQNKQKSMKFKGIFSE